MGRRDKGQRAVEAVRDGVESAKGPLLGPNNRRKRPDIVWGYEPPRIRTRLRAKRELRKGGR